MKKNKTILPFILIISCFALWGFANDITHPMVKSFSKIFRMTVTQGSLIQVAFYAGYFAMAIPAALFIKRYSYKAGILFGLAMYAIGALMFIPAARIGVFEPFLVAYFIMTCGLSFLETSANPLVLTMGCPENSTRFLNLAQSFNPIGSLCGMFVAMHYVQARLNPMPSAERFALDDASFNMLKSADLDILVRPYVFIGLLLIIIFTLIYFTKLPNHPNSTKNSKLASMSAVRRLFENISYREGIIAQFFYIGAQITCWTFIIQLGTSVFMSEGFPEYKAEILSQRLNIVAMVIFCVSRFISTWLMKYFKSSKMLVAYGIAAIALISVVILVKGRIGLYCLVATSAFMSLMFPTIYGLALKDVGEDTELGSAGLIMAILGGSVLPPFQAMIIDAGYIGLSFIVPLICFIVVSIFGIRQLRISNN